MLDALTFKNKKILARLKFFLKKKKKIRMDDGFLNLYHSNKISKTLNQISSKLTKMQNTKLNKLTKIKHDKVNENDY